MNLSVNDYQKIYQLQDNVFRILSGHYGSLYLTDGTALGRFYLNHRYSNDIDLFANADIAFKDVVTKIRIMLDTQFNTLTDKLIIYDNFIRIWVEANNYELKIEFVNDVPARYGRIFHVKNIPVDNPGNILANKLSAVVGRDEPKDVFDIIYLSLNYSFNWAKIFEQCIRKAIVAEQNVAERLATFPVEMLENKPWLKTPVDLNDSKEKLERIADDFLFARNNSLGKNKIYIEKAVPEFQMN